MVDNHKITGSNPVRPTFMEPKYVTYLDEVSLPSFDDEVNNCVILWDREFNIVGWLDRRFEDVPVSLKDHYPDDQQKLQIVNYCYNVLLCGQE